MNVECTLCGSTTALTGACRGCGAPAAVEGQSTRRHGKSEEEKLRAEVERMRDALTKISAIRDSIVGMQGFNFSEHAYPLVAVLDAAGFSGAGYEIARANLGTLIEQRDRTVAERDALRAVLAKAHRDMRAIQALVRNSNGIRQGLPPTLVKEVIDLAFVDDVDAALAKEPK